MLARTCNRKPCELAQFETTWRMASPAARTSCRACHVRCCHDVEPEERFKLNRKKYHAIVAVRNRSDTVGETTTRRQKPLVLRIRVEQLRTKILFLPGLTPRCEQIFPHRCCFQPVRRFRQQMSHAPARTIMGRKWDGVSPARDRAANPISAAVSDRYLGIRQSPNPDVHRSCDC